MNPKELMIGNLVMCEGKAREVIGLTASSITLDGNDVFEGDRLKLIEPLPVTAETLTLAGAVLSRGKWWLNYEEANLIGDRIIFDVAEGYSRSFKSIHKMQNWVNIC